MKTGEGTTVWHPELSNIHESVEFGRNCKVHSHVWIGEGITFGDGCSIQAFCYVPPWVSFGNDVFLGPRVTFLNDKKPPSYGKHWIPTVVEDGVSVGAGAVILPGVKLGRGCMIGAGAVVTKDVEPGQVVVGNPARPLDKAL